MKSSILKRDIFDKIQPFLGTKNIIVLHGARQVGKTHILYYIQNYLKEKQAFLEQRTANVDIFSIGEREKLEYELRSINRILKEIYERRETKIIAIAINKSKTGSEIIDTSAMLREEKELYQELLDKMNQFRREVFLKLLNHLQTYRQMLHHHQLVVQRIKVA